MDYMVEVFKSIFDFVGKLKKWTKEVKERR